MPASHCAPSCLFGSSAVRSACTLSALRIFAVMSRSTCSFSASLTSLSMYCENPSGWLRSCSCRLSAALRAMYCAKKNESFFTGTESDAVAASIVLKRPMPVGCKVRSDSASFFDRRLMMSWKKAKRSTLSGEAEPVMSPEASALTAVSASETSVVAYTAMLRQRSFAS